MVDTVLNDNIKQALAVVADYICRKRYDTDWRFMADLSGVDIDWEKHPRLLKAQFFGDPDYPSAIIKFLKDIYEKNPEGAKLVISRIIGEEIDEEPLKGALTVLGIIRESDQARIIIPSIPQRRYKYLELDSFPDDFYAELIDNINRCYECQLYVPLQILVRKLFENCLIDILRMFYGTRELNLFYNVEKGRFHDFNTLLKNAKQKLKDFSYVKDVFNQQILKLLNKYRERGNAMAHNLAIRTSKDEVDSFRKEITYLTKCLFKTIKLLSTPK